MSLQAVLFDFNGVIINDEPIHQELINEILLSQNLPPNPSDYNECCLGRTDLAGLLELLQRRGRAVNERSLAPLIAQKAQRYQQKLEALHKLPIYPGVEDLIYKVRVARLRLGLVTGALRSEVEWILKQANLFSYFEVIVAGDEVQQSKPHPEGYLRAIERFNELDPTLHLSPQCCLVIEDTPAGILAAKNAGMQVVGVANTYPFHMIQRQANWTVDYLHELELDRVQACFEPSALPFPNAQ